MCPILPYLDKSPYLVMILSHCQRLETVLVAVVGSSHVHKTAQDRPRTAGGTLATGSRVGPLQSLYQPPVPGRFMPYGREKVGFSVIWLTANKASDKARPEDWKESPWVSEPPLGWTGLVIIAETRRWSLLWDT